MVAARPSLYGFGVLALHSVFAQPQAPQPPFRDGDSEFGIHAATTQTSPRSGTTSGSSSGFLGRASDSSLPRLLFESVATDAAATIPEPEELWNEYGQFAILVGAGLCCGYLVVVAGLCCWYRARNCGRIFCWPCLCFCRCCCCCWCSCCRCCSASRRDQTTPEEYASDDDDKFAAQEPRVAPRPVFLSDGLDEMPSLSFLNDWRNADVKDLEAANPDLRALATGTEQPALMNTASPKAKPPPPPADDIPGYVRRAAADCSLTTKKSCPRSSSGSRNARSRSRTRSPASTPRPPSTSPPSVTRAAVRKASPAESEWDVSEQQSTGARAGSTQRSLADSDSLCFRTPSLRRRTGRSSSPSLNTSTALVPLVGTRGRPDSPNAPLPPMKSFGPALSPMSPDDFERMRPCRRPAMGRSSSPLGRRNSQVEATSGRERRRSHPALTRVDARRAAAAEMSMSRSRSPSKPFGSSMDDGENASPPQGTPPRGSIIRAASPASTVSMASPTMRSIYARVEGPERAPSLSSTYRTSTKTYRSITK